MTPSKSKYLPKARAVEMIKKMMPRNVPGFCRVIYEEEEHAQWAATPPHLFSGSKEAQARPRPPEFTACDAVFAKFGSRVK